MKKAYIVLTHSGSVLSRVIKKITKSEYTHTSISFSKNLDSMYSFGRLYPRVPIFGGFVVEEINNGFYTVFKNTHCIVFEIEVTDAEYRKLNKSIKKYLKNKDKYKYNFIGLLTLLFNYSFTRDNHMFCSQFVDSLLKESGIELVEKSSEFVRPMDFYNHDKLKVAYNGKLNDYETLVNNESFAEC